MSKQFVKTSKFFTQVDHSKVNPLYYYNIYTNVWEMIFYNVVIPLFIHDKISLISGLMKIESDFEGLYNLKFGLFKTYSFIACCLKILKRVWKYKTQKRISSQGIYLKNVINGNFTENLSTVYT